MSPALRDKEGRIERHLGLEFDAGDVIDVPLRLGFALIDERAVCVSVEIGTDFSKRDAPEPKEIRTSTLRRINLAGIIQDELLRRARADQEKVAQLERVGVKPPRALVDVASSWAGTKRHPGRPRLYGDEHYREVARIYNEHGSRARTKAVAQHFNVSKTAAAKWVAEARRQDLIPPW